MRKFASALLTGAAVMVMASSAHATFDLDTFGDPDTDTATQFGVDNVDLVGVSANNPETGNSTPAPGVERLLSAIRTSPTGNMSVGINEDGNGVFNLDLGVGSSGAAWISYDLGALDLFNDDSINAFAIDLVEVDEAAIIGVAVGDSAPGSLPLPGAEGTSFTEGDSGVLYISFDDLPEGDWVTLFIDSSNAPNADTAIDTFGVVCLRDGRPTDGPVDVCTPPTDVSEPGTVGLVGLGLIGLAAAARRRKA